MKYDFPLHHHLLRLTTIVYLSATTGNAVVSLSLYFTEFARIQVTALDGIINVNSLFTVDLFLGLASVSDPKTVDLNLIQEDGNSRKCSASMAVVRNLVSFQVNSFSCFMFSILVALSLKQAIRVTEEDSGSTDVAVADRTMVRGDATTATLGHINSRVLRMGIFMSALGSGFLMMEIENLVQIKLGIFWFGSGSGHTLAAIMPLLCLVPSSLLVHLGLSIYAFRR